MPVVTGRDRREVQRRRAGVHISDDTVEVD
jgi:hypothetical protein